MAQEICDGCIVVKVDVDVEANVDVCCVANIFLHLETFFKFNQVEKMGKKSEEREIIFFCKDV
jgi:hypothetical protein